MTRRSAFLLVLLGFLLAAWHPAPVTRYVLNDASKLWITGTSTVHDWHCDATRVSGWIDATMGTPATIAGAQIRVRPDAIDCDNGTMDGKVRDALKADAHPTITFALTSAEVGVGTRESFSVRATGRLTIAGQTKTVTTALQGSISPDGLLRFSGELPVTMSTYGIKPPTALLGTLKTGDDVVVHVELVAALAGT